MNCGERLKVVASEGQDEGDYSEHEQTLPAGYHLEREATEPLSSVVDRVQRVDEDGAALAMRTQSRLGDRPAALLQTPKPPGVPCGARVTDWGLGSDLNVSHVITRCLVLRATKRPEGPLLRRRPDRKTDSTGTNGVHR